MKLVVNSKDFIHENDRKALETLKAIPGFDQLVKGFMKVYSEKAMKILNMSSKVRLSAEQCPRIYNLLTPICDCFGIEIPEMYLELDRNPNAYTSGDTYVFITVTTGLLELMSDEEIQTVLAHECGHIVCHHVLYHTVGQILLHGSMNLLGLGPLVNTALSTAFFTWMRCSEFSADRAAAVFCEGPERVVDVMLSLAGGKSYDLKAEPFIQQSEEYKRYIGTSNWNKVLEFLTVMDNSHPFLTVRASSINEWCNSKSFQNIMSSKLNAKNMLSDGSHCHKCGSRINNGWVFCRHCRAPLNIQRLEDTGYGS